MAYYIDRLHLVHFGEYGTRLRRSTELSQGSGQGPQHHVDLSPLQSALGVVKRLLVVAEVVVCQRNQTDVKRCEWVTRSRRKQRNIGSIVSAN